MTTPLKAIAAALAILSAASSNAAITRKVDTYDGSVILQSITYEPSLTISLDGYNTSETHGQFDFYQFYKKRAANGALYTMLYIAIPNATYSYMGYDSQGSIKVDNSIIPLTRLPFDSIKSIYLDMTPALTYLRNGMNHQLTIRVTGPRGTFTADLPESIKKEWIRLLETDINDEGLLAVKPIGSQIFTVGKSITGWAVDPKNDLHKPIIHVYRGNTAITAITANIEDCKTGKACSALTEQNKSWRNYVYQYNLEGITGASTEPIRLIALNSNPNHPAEVIASANMVLRDDIECIYNWAEEILLGDIISEKQTTRDEGVHRVRRYSNGSMLAAVYGSGDFSFSIKGGTHTPGGNISQFLGDAISQNCGR
ncbi:MAG: hypothetical protein HUU13_02620 [Burkholderiaceae bacterium]|nr:hypothetical protein [Burkholderiaceae bacterium]